MRMWLKREYYRRLLQPMNQLELTPAMVGRTFAIGVAAGLSATVGLQSVIVIILWAIARWTKRLQFNLAIAWVLTGITNPLTFVPFYTFYYAVGVTLLGKTEGAYDVSTVWLRMEEQGVMTILLDSWKFLLITFFGSLPFTLAGGIAAYYLGVWLGERMASRRKIRFLRLEQLREKAKLSTLPLAKALPRLRKPGGQEPKVSQSGGLTPIGTPPNAGDPDEAALDESGSVGAGPAMAASPATEPVHNPVLEGRDQTVGTTARQQPKPAPGYARGRSDSPA